MPPAAVIGLRQGANLLRERKRPGVRADFAIPKNDV